MNLNILSVLKKLRYTHKLSLFNPFLSINIKSFHSTTIVSLNQIITDEKVKFQLEGEKNNNLLKEIEVKKERKSSSRLNKRITKREEKNSIRLLRLRKKLVRSWRLKRSKLSRLDFKFRINILAKIYKKIKLINRSKLRSRLRSNIAPKLGRLISYYQYYNTKSTNKISNLLKEYNLMLLENNIQKKNGELNSFSLLDTFKGNSHKILNSSLKNTGINKKIIQGLDSLWVQEKSNLVQNYNTINLNNLNLERNKSNIKTDEIKEKTKSFSEINYNLSKNSYLPKNSMKLSLYLYHNYLKTQYLKNLENIKYLSSASSLGLKTLSYFETIKGFMGRSLNFNNQLLYHSKIISYNFSKINNKFNILGGNNSIENLLKDLFYILSSIISKPVFIMRQDKLIIRLFLFLSPKISTKLKSSLLLKNKKQNTRLSNKFKISKNPLISKTFKEKYWKNLNQIKLMSYNSSLDRLGLNYKNSEDILGINVLGYSHTGELVLDNLSNSSLLKETNKKRNKISYLLHKKYLNTREYFIKTNYKNYPAYVQLVLSQMYFSYLSSNNKKIPLLSKPVHYKKDINDKLLINNIKSSYSKLQNYLIFKRSNIKSGITKIIKSKNRFKLLNRTKYFLFEKKSISLGSLNKSRAKKRQMFNINSLITFRGKHQYNKKTLKRFEKLSFSNFINWPLTESQIRLYTLFFNKIALIPLNSENSSISSNVQYLKSLQRKDHSLFKNIISEKLSKGRKNSVVSFFTLFKNRLNKIVKLISKILNIKVELEIIKVETPFQDSSMISQILGYNSKKWYFYRMWRILLPKIGIQNPTQNLTYMIEKKEEDIERKLKGITYESTSYLPPLFNKNKLDSKFIGFKTMNSNHNLSSYVSGISMKLAGRLMTQKMRPRFTVQMKQNGSLARVKVDYTEKSRYTSKNKRGAFSFTISIGHIIK